MNLRILLSLSALLALPAPATAGAASPSALPTDSVYHLSASLTDSDGGPVRWSELRGQPRVVTMFYASCRFVCPMIIDSARSIERSLPAGERERIGFVLISMDSARDTPAALARLKRERRLGPDGWLLLRSEPADLRSLAAVLGIRYRALADGEFNHTTTLVLLDREGRVLARTEQIGGKGDPAFLAAVKAVAAR